MFGLITRHPLGQVLDDFLGEEPQVSYAQCKREQIQRLHLADTGGALTCTTCGTTTARSAA